MCQEISMQVGSELCSVRVGYRFFKMLTQWNILNCQLLFGQWVLDNDKYFWNVYLNWWLMSDFRRVCWNLKSWPPPTPFHLHNTPSPNSTPIYHRVPCIFSRHDQSMKPIITIDGTRYQSITINWLIMHQSIPAVPIPPPPPPPGQTRGIS